MFGLLKESIVDNLSNDYYQDKKVFKKHAKTIIGEAKKSKTFQEYLSTYQMIAEAKFTNIDEAKIFLDETISYMKSLDKTQLDKFYSNVKLNEEYGSKTYQLIDGILAEDTNLSDKIKYKTELIKLLVKPDEEKKIVQRISVDPTYENVFNRILTKKLNDKISTLSEDEQKVLKVLIKEDKNLINETYNGLIDENLEKLKNINSTAKNLVEVELNKMKNETATPLLFVRLIQLKNDLNETE